MTTVKLGEFYTALRVANVPENHALQAAQEVAEEMEARQPPLSPARLSSPDATKFDLQLPTVLVAASIVLQLVSVILLATLLIRLS